MRTSRSASTKKQSLEPVSSRCTHSQISSKSKTEPPEVKPKPRWRSSSSSKINEPVQFKLQLSDVLSRDTVTSSQGMESRLRLKTKLQEQKETPKKPLDVKPKPWRAKFGEKELTFKDNILTFELKTKLRARSLLEKETVTITQEQEEYGDLDTSHTRQGNYRKFADHRLSVRRRKRHRPTSNPVRQLKKRKDIRSEF
ncbi:uncharacterized protein LOC116292821 [Actinia tenebrosa]|uniref:Uncharacterized protein LOC116292821 n=1 Tax=Actinia tenebrosa TaxID=6105 RepID=A0A6P8HTL8_ACTTE|nr:uncharacterized protein LOC116292821 [Actinia tenebrosa]